MPRAMKLGELAQFLGATLVGDAGAEVSSLAALRDAGPGALSFLANPKYQSHLDSTGATAVILQERMLARCPCNALVVANPYLAFARASHLFDRAPVYAPGIHPSAVIDASARIGDGVYIGPCVVIEAGVSIGDGCSIGAQCFIGMNSSLGANCRLWPNVTICHHVTVGERTIMHAGVVVGADGFGFAPDGGKWQKIAQVGGVRIGNDVDIGALTTIDRGAIEDTVIGDGVILDDQVHIAHNVVVGDYTAMAGKAGISGSTKVGKHCLISGMAGLVGHIELCDNVQISGMTVVSRSIDEPGVYTSGTGMEPHASWAKNAARFRQLDAMARRLADLEKRLKELEGK